MDDPALYTNFITNVAGVTVARVRNELLSFANTFRVLSSTSDKEIDAFVKNTHDSNSARANNAKILIPTQAVMALKVILFELKDRDMCDALPTAAVLGALNANQIQILCAQRTQALKEEKLDVNVTVSMEIPKLTATNYETFIASFTSLASRTKSHSGPTLDFLMREVNGNYDDPRWASRSA